MENTFLKRGRITLDATWKRTTSILLLFYYPFLKNHNYLPSRILIFGGGGKDKRRFNDVNLLDIATSTWQNVVVKNSESIISRTYHTSNLFFDRYLAVFGGESTTDLNDICILSFVGIPEWYFQSLMAFNHIFLFMTMQRTVLSPVGLVPSKRRFHSSGVV